MQQVSAPVAVITGAASGLGRAMALEWAGRGYLIAVLDRDDDGAAATVRLVEAGGGIAEAIHCDVSQLEQLESAAAHVFARWGRVDLLVNSAGTETAGAVGDIPISEWRKIITGHYDAYRGELFERVVNRTVDFLLAQLVPHGVHASNGARAPSHVV